MTPQELAAIYQAIGTVIGAVIVGLIGGALTLWYNLYRAKQDKESAWRSHALELTKLDIEVKLKIIEVSKKTEPIRPSVLDFLANYRDLQELGDKTPKNLYLEILEKRISKPNETSKEAEQKA